MTGLRTAIPSGRDLAALVRLPAPVVARSSTVALRESLDRFTARTGSAR